MAAAYSDMTSARGITPRSIWVGRILSGLAMLALGADALAKLVVPQAMIDTSPPLGLPADPGLYRVLGAILLASLIFHVVPRTRLFGAILITGFLGGAIAMNVRAEMPLFSNTLFGVYLGVLVWGGLWLRDVRIRALLS